MSPRPQDTGNNDSSAPLSSAQNATRKQFSHLAVYVAKLPNSSVNSVCGALAGAASGIATCPLDVIKTKLQAQGGFRPQQSVHNAPGSRAVYRGMIGTARTIIRQDGLRGMYRGLGPMLLGYLPTWAVYMSVYDRSKVYFYTRTDNTFLAQVYSSVTAGACSTLATNPIWVIKTRLMSQVSHSVSDGSRTPWHYNNTWDAARKMWAAEGIAAFYSGLTPALLGLTHVAIQFPLYELFKKMITGVEMGAVPKEGHVNNTLGIALATFASKIIATSATYPHEVVRTRLQTQQRMHPAQSADGVTHRGSDGSRGRAPGSSDGFRNQLRYKGIIRTCKVILHEEGWRAFYNGMGTNMIRAVPAAMTTMLTFESLKGAMHRMRDEGRQILDEKG
ncbi:hypothetical protein LTR66_012414 [Elasticomyces elasticus]|nr:hypothetical protein LTR66_012414 [Elasticomyces elasticus]KAK4992434.1 hypothetical protein LTR50_001193 [Elasticomyces elasticus]